MADGTLMGLRAPWRSGRTYLIGGALFILLLLMSAAILGDILRAGALSESRHSIDQLSTALAEQTARSVQAVDLVLQDTENRLAIATAKAGGDIDEAMASPEVNEVLRERQREVPQLDAIVLVNARGQVANFSRSFPAPPISVTDRDYFQAFQDGTRHGTYISAPVRSRASDAWTVYLVRRLAGPGAGPGSEFRGLVMGALPLEAIERFYQAVTTRPGSAVTLLRNDGVVLARFPHEEELIGRPRPADDAHGKLIAVHALLQEPLAVEVSITREAALATWRRQSWAVWFYAVLVAVCLGLLLRLIARQIAAEHAAQRSLSARNADLEAAGSRLERQADELTATAAALRDSERLLAEHAARLNLTMEHVDQGLLMVDARGVIAAYNGRVVEMLGLPEALMARHPDFREVLRWQTEAGEFARTSPALLELVRAGSILDSPQVYERERPNGRMIEVRTLPLPGGGMVRTYSDITERKATEAQIRRTASLDTLTGLANRAALHHHLTEVLRGGAPSRTVAVLHLDLDRFRLINDARGHETGDRLLAAAARRIEAACRADDLIARIGGDEFAVVRAAGAGEQDGPALAASLVERLAEPYVMNGLRLAVTVSVGVAVAEPGIGVDALQRNADIAMYCAKDAGRNGLRLYEPTMTAARQARFQLEQALREALGRQDFQLVYQPVVSLESNAVVGYEALLRWTDKSRGPVSPAEFVPVAETTGLIVPIGRWVLERACTEAAGWTNSCSIAVNLSPVQFRQDDLLEAVQGCLARSGLRPDRLELEVTEGVLLEDTGVVRETMMALRKAGVVITLDDFGTGHAGLSYLSRFPFDKLKIDRSFIQNLGEDQHSDAIVEAILLLGRRLQLPVVAEGVESEAQLDLLRTMRCPLVQGYLTGRPMFAELARAL
ncbi:MAG: EAL domain-containing protein [Acetobacteraceae bacterium]